MDISNFKTIIINFANKMAASSLGKVFWMYGRVFPAVALIGLALFINLITPAYASTHVGIREIAYLIVMLSSGLAYIGYVGIYARALWLSAKREGWTFWGVAAVAFEALMALTVLKAVLYA